MMIFLKIPMDNNAIFFCPRTTRLHPNINVTSRIYEHYKISLHN